jgi:hypothetical protein
VDGSMGRGGPVAESTEATSNSSSMNLRLNCSHSCAEQTAVGVVAAAIHPCCGQQCGHISQHLLLPCILPRQDENKGEHYALTAVASASSNHHQPDRGTGSHRRTHSTGSPSMCSGSDAFVNTGKPVMRPARAWPSPSSSLYCSRTSSDIVHGA